MYGVDRGQSQARCEHAVEGGRRSAALNVPEHRRSGLIARPLLDLALQQVADPAEPSMTELVELARSDFQGTFSWGRTLGRHDDREITPALVTMTDQAAHLVDVEWALRDQDHVGAAGHSGMQRDPACM